MGGIYNYYILQLFLKKANYASMWKYDYPSQKNPKFLDQVLSLEPSFQHQYMHVRLSTCSNTNSSEGETRFQSISFIEYVSTVNEDRCSHFRLKLV